MAQIALHAAVPGTLDTTFNPNGIQPGTVVTTINNFNAYYNYNSDAGIALQDDGKIVVAGTANNGDTYQFGAARFNTDGSLDTSFNAGGALPGTTVVPVINGINSFCSSVAIQSDGKIVLGGYGYNGAFNSFAVARLNSDGSLDTTFNAAGTESAVPGVAMQGIGAINVSGYSIAIQSDGKIVIGGSTSTAMAAARFNSDGTTDTSSFNPAGLGSSEPGTVVIPVINGSNSQGYSVAVQSDGSILISGYAYSTIGSGSTFAVARFTPDGLLDASFNSSGLVSNQPGVVIAAPNGYASGDYAYAVLVQPDGKIVLVGGIEDSYGFGIARLNTDGSLDASFNPTGVVPGTTQIIINASIYAYSIALGAAIQPDGKIVMVGFAYMPPFQQNQFAYARVNSNGTADAAFLPEAAQPGSGATTINNWMNQASAYGVAIQKNGRIVVAGVASPDNTNYSFGLARLNGVDTNNTFALELIDKYSPVV